MSSEDFHPDLDRLRGPDRRWVPSASLGMVVLAMALLTVLGLVVLWPRESAEIDLAPFGVTSDVVSAEVEGVEAGPCANTDPEDEIRCIRVTFDVMEGADSAQPFVQEFADIESAPRFEVGDRVLLSVIPEAPPEFRYQFDDRERRPVLVWVAVAFALAVVWLGRWRGAAAVVGLTASVVVLIAFILPAILSGRNPVLVATVGAAAIGLMALYLAHGVSPLTHVATLGTMAALMLTAALSTLVTAAADLSGLTSEESLFLTLLPTQVDPRGLVLAGIVLGALGALDDVTVTQARAIWELRAANPSMSIGDLTAAGLRVGRDHIASTVNTLLLAYAGASLPLLVLFAVSHRPMSVVANSEVVATEIIRTLVGSIGLVAAVPLTTIFAARTASAGSPVLDGLARSQLSRHQGRSRRRRR